ncbi:MAG: NAD-dependent epimerase/dehydratase family protein [Luteitalea sp.]|nr:NAD-dependent epimerase/dehydratase family protein [Luteitalea sp.]
MPLRPFTFAAYYPEQKVSDRPVLVTGAAGFAGSHLLDLLIRDGRPIVGWYRPGSDEPRTARDGVTWRAVELLDGKAVQRALADMSPSALYHLAGAAHQASSWQESDTALALNVRATHHLLEVLRRRSPGTRVLVTGSAAVYRPAAVPLEEDAPLAPTSPYGLSKLAQELLALRAAHDDKLEVIVTRSFNHIGPGQSPQYFASSFALQLARIEAGLEAPVISVGNLEPQRDLTDVRDTVQAYKRLMAHGRPGTTYNVCSGHAYAIGDVLGELRRHATREIEVRVDTTRLRPTDQALLVGNPARLTTDTGWRPEIPLSQTLADLLAWHRARLTQ